MRKTFKKAKNYPGAYYIISKKWLRNWKETHENSFLPLYNEDLLDFDKIRQGFEGIDTYLKPNLILKKDYVVLDEATQDFFDSKWQGFKIKRYFQSPSIPTHLYPEEKHVVLITDDALKNVEFGHKREFNMKIIQIDSGLTLEGLQRKYFKKTENKIRVWKVDFRDLDEIFNDFRENCKNCMKNYCFYMKFGYLIEQTSGYLSLNSNEGLFIDFDDLETGFHLINEKNETISKCDFCSRLTISHIRCPCKKVAYCTYECREKDIEYHAKSCDQTNEIWDNEAYKMTEDSVKGLCGLRNLGNSCYMNSALQCLSNCGALSQYFMSQEFKKDLNRNNVMGLQGKMAQKYAELLRELWCGNRNVFAPSGIKSLISNKNFGEFSQEDSQEFLVFMLDLLHEDLNRGGQNHEKQHVEKENPSAAEFWRNYLKRNNSIVVETFTGIFKSRILCPCCHNVSITYDPFLVCPLPIPKIKKKSIEMKIIRKEAQLNVEEVTYRFLSETNSLSDLTSDVKSHFSIDFELFEWDDKNLVPITEMQKLTSDVKKEIKIRSSSLLAFEKFKKEAPQILIQLFFCKSVGSTSKIKISKFPRLLPLFTNESHASPQKLYDVIGEYLLFFLNEKEKCSEISKKTEENNNFFSKLFSTPKSPYPFKLISKSNGETLNPSSSQKISEKLIEIEVVWADEPPKSFDCFYISKNAIVEIERFSQEQEKINLPITISDCLQFFSREERLDEKNQWQCPNCKNLQQAIKKMEIYQSPPILILQLKRFKTRKGGQKGKINDLVKFPVLAELDLSNFVINHEYPERSAGDGGKREVESQEAMVILNRYGRLFSSNRNIFHRVLPKKLDDNDDLLFEEDEIVTISTDNTLNREKPKLEAEPLLYELIGVIEHRGGMGGGHYTAKCKNEITKKWYNFDDEHVTEETEQNILSNNAYILFYKRKK